VKRFWLVVLFNITTASAEAPQIELPPSLPEETTSQVLPLSAEPISTSEKDLADPNWRFYQNRIVKASLRVMAQWTVMEFKEANDSGTVSFTISRMPLITFAVVRAPLEGPFDSYVSLDALTPLYPKIQKRTPTTFAGRKGILIQGLIEDGRTDESHFSTDGKSFYRASFSAPQTAWKDAEKQFDAIKKSFRWLK
jgi:hypothetical protein